MTGVQTCALPIYLVTQGVPFREAHHIIGAMVARAEAKGCTLPELSDADAAAISDQFGANWREVFTLERAFAAREATGMPGPNVTRERLEEWRRLLHSATIVSK